MVPNTPGLPGRHGPLASRLVRAAAAVGLGLLTSAAEAGPPPAGTSDVALARAALASLDADPGLRDVNLVVSVVDRVAVIGGPVPSADAGRRAEGLVRGVPGVADVKNRCFVQAGPDPLLRAMAGGPPRAPRPFFTDLPPVSPGARPARPDPPALAATGPAAAHPGTRSVTALRPANPADGVLLPPVGVTGPGATPTAPAVQPPYGPRPPLAADVGPGRDPPRPADVPAAVEAVRAANPRYAGLRVATTDGTVVITGTAARAADAWDLAGAVRKVPGVLRVAVNAQ